MRVVLIRGRPLYLVATYTHMASLPPVLVESSPAFLCFPFVCPFPSLPRAAAQRFLFSPRPAFRMAAEVGETAYKAIGVPDQVRNAGPPYIHGAGFNLCASV